jgi:hypothetical protein
LIVVMSSLGLDIRRRLCLRSTGYDGRIHGHPVLAAVARKWWGGAVVGGPCSTVASPAVGSAMP